MASDPEFRCKLRLNLTVQGGFGNCCFQYAFAKAFALRHDLELCCSWPAGEAVFQLTHSAPAEGCTRITETHAVAREADKPFLIDIELRGYFQSQSSLIYTRTQAKEWFQLRPEIVERLRTLPFISDRLCHVRRGDYAGYGYPLVSPRSYFDAATQFGIGPNTLYFIEDEGSKYRDSAGFDGALAFLPDFYRLTKASVLFRANSTFSWWAAVLGNGQVFSPLIDGLEGGKEHDCAFVDGNWPRFANLDFVTDLHLHP